CRTSSLTGIYWSTWSRFRCRAEMCRTPFTRWNLPCKTSARGRNRMRIIRVITFVALGLLATVTSATQNNFRNSPAELNDILERMAAHDAWQNGHLLEYEVHRKFYAANARFKLESVLEVKTKFRRPNTFESEVLRSEGSTMIRERVFDKILDAEKEVNSDT